MGVITLTRQEDKYILMNTLERKEVLQQQIIQLMQSTGFEGVVPFELRQVRGKRVILSDLTGTYSILTRLQSPIDSRELVLILKGLLEAITLVSKKQIPPNYIDLDLDYIFIRRDGKVLLTLWAIEGLAPKVPLPILFKQIGEQAQPSAKRDKNFIDGYLGLFDQGFTMRKLENFVNTSYDMLRKTVVEGASSDIDLNPIKEMVRDQPKAKTNPKGDIKNSEPDKTVTKEPEVERPQPVEDEDVLVPTDKTTFLVDLDDEDDGKTTLLTDDAGITRYLVRVNTEDRFDISNGETVIGKQADVSFTDNKAISRRHAKILVFDGVVTIEDLNSSNGTKVNGKKISAGETEQLMDGDVITLANEDFEYHEE